MKARLAIVALLAFAPTLAAAPANTVAKTAKDHLLTAKKLIDQKQYDQAIQELEAAYELDPQPEHIYNLGVAHQLRGDDAIASEYYRLYLLDAPAGKPEVPRATRYLESLEKSLDATRAAKQQKDLAELQAKSQNGNNTAEVLLFAQYTSDAETKEHQLAAIDDEIHSIEAEQAAAQKRTSDLRAATTSAMARAQRWERHAREAASGDGRGRRVFGTVLMTVGTAAVTLGVHDLLSRESGVHIADNADEFMGVGAGALLGGLLVFVWGESASTDPRPASAFHLAPTLGRDAGGLTFTGSF